MLDLGHPGDADIHRCRDLSPAEAEVLAGLGELMPAGLREQKARPGFDLLGGDAGGMQFLLEDFPVLGIRFGITWLLLVIGHVFEVQPLSGGDVIAVPALPVAGLVAAEQQQR